MKRSTQVAAPLLAAAALAITTGCEKPQMQRCVDQNNKVVDDSFCANLPPAQNQQNQNFGSPGYIPYFPLYRYYYGGWGGYGLGSMVGGGSYFPEPSRSYVTRSGVTTRGGFGRSFSGSEGGGGMEAVAIMQRIPRTPRNNWQQTVESQGLTFHTLDNGQPYWDESAAYQFTSSEIDTLEAAGNTLQEMCLSAAQHIIDNKRYAELNIPAEAIPAIEWAWNNEPPSALRPLRHKLGGRPVRPRPQAPRIQRRHPHLAPRSRGNPVELARRARPGPRPQTRSVQLHPRKAHRQMARRRPLPLEANLLRRARQPRRPAHPLLPSRQPPSRPACPPPSSSSKT